MPINWGVGLGKNVTIYLPNGVARRMAEFPEVNWSEICRKAIVDYIETRSQVDLGPIIERLKKERNELYRKGQLFMYGEVIPKLSWEEVEFLRKIVDVEILKSPPTFINEEKREPLVAEQLAIFNMRRQLRGICKEKNIKLPEDLPRLSDDPFYQGAIDALLDMYYRVIGKRRATSR